MRTVGEIMYFKEPLKLQHIDRLGTCQSIKVFGNSISDESYTVYRYVEFYKDRPNEVGHIYTLEELELYSKCWDALQHWGSQETNKIYIDAEKVFFDKCKENPYNKENDWVWHRSEATRLYLEIDWNPIWNRPLTDEEKLKKDEYNKRISHHRSMWYKLFEEK